MQCSVIVSLTEKSQQFPVELKIEISRSENFPVRPGPSRVLSQQWLQAGPNLESPGSTLSPHTSPFFLPPPGPIFYWEKYKYCFNSRTFLLPGKSQTSAAAVPGPCSDVCSPCVMQGPCSVQTVQETAECRQYLQTLLPGQVFLPRQSRTLNY